MDAIDVFGLYLDPWGFRFDGSVFSWAVGIPILIGLVGVTFREVRKHAAVAIMGATAAFFSIIPRVDPVGDLMVDYEIFFPSRFVFPDYKAGLALAIIVFGVVGWRNIIDHRLDRRAAAASVGLLLVWGLWAAARLAERVPTRVPLLVVVMVALGVGLATLPRSRRSLPGGVTVALLLALVIGDGFRFNYDQEFEITAQTPWIYYLPDDLRNQRDHAAAVLDDVLANPPASRPARIAPAQPVDVRPGGSPPDALGYLGLGYNMNSYNNFMTDARKNALDDPVLYERLAAPWTPWLVHCDTDDCADITELPDPALWQSTSSILTTEYGLDTIDYVVSAEETVLFVENEINFPGWQASDDRVELLEHSGSFRAWIVEPGNYSFTARYDPVEGRRQVQLFGLGLLVWIATGVWWALRCRRSVLPGLVQSGSDGVGCDDRSVRSDPAFND